MENGSHMTPARLAILVQHAAAHDSETARDFAATPEVEPQIVATRHQVAAYYQQKSAMLYRYARMLADNA